MKRFTRNRQAGHSSRPFLGWARAIGLVCASAVFLSHGARTGSEAAAGDAPPAEPSTGTERVLRVSIEQRIDPTYQRSLVARIRARIEHEPAIAFAVVRIETEEGAPQAIRDLATFVFEELRSLRTIAWIPDGTRANTVGTVLALAANEIVMGQRSQLGNVDEEFGDLVARFADRRGYSGILVKAMVWSDHDDILAVPFRTDRAGDPGVETKYLYRRDYESNLTLEEKRLKQGEGELLVPRGERLVVDETSARRHGLARAIVPERDGIEGMLAALNIPVGLGAVIDLDRGALKKTSAQGIINFFNHPLVRALLILGGCLGILLELKMLGTLVPGLVGIGFFLIFFVTSSLPASTSVEGTASLFEIALFVIGLGFLAGELFLMPGVAVFGIVGAALCGISLVLSMVPSEASAMGGGMTVKDAIVVLVGGLGAGAAVFLALLRVLPRTRILGHRGIVSYAAIEGVPSADNVLQAQSISAELIGKEGVVETGLRPAGTIALDDGRILDVVSEGEFIERGVRVVVALATATRIVVHRAEGAVEDESGAHAGGPADT